MKHTDWFFGLLWLTGMIFAVGLIFGLIPACTGDSTHDQLVAGLKQQGCTDIVLLPPDEWHCGSGARMARSFECRVKDKLKRGMVCDNWLSGPVVIFR